jgi:type II secretory ATPase GspE/PulE/Tfp pilus assembly ATPase PilB-like protein
MVRLFRALPAAIPPVGLVLLADVQTAIADTVWPNEDAPFQRGPGGYLSLPKILFCWLLFLLWVRTTDWVNQDVQRLRLDYSIWNSSVFFSFVAAFVVMWLLPWFWLGAFLMVVAYAGPLVGYIIVRNRAVPVERKVLTRAHLRYLLSHRAALFGVKISAEKQESKKLGPAVNFTAKGGKTDRDNSANLLLARQSPGFPLARRLIADALDHRADAILLDVAAQGVTTRLQIDGVWQNHEPYERIEGDPMLAVFKTIGGLNVNERRSAKQEGAFDAQFHNAKRSCKITSQRTAGGERIVLQLIDATVKKFSYEELGMRAKVEEQLRALLELPQGLVLYSAPPGGGLSTLMDTGIRSLDRFLRDVVVVEDAARREHEIENALVTTFNSAAGETPMAVLPKIARTYPNIYVLRELADADTVNFLCEQTKEARLSVGGLRAKEAAEVLLRVLVMKVPAGEFAPAVLGVVNQRLIRKLCEKCKQEYAPPPEVLKQLGLTADRVPVLFRPPQPEPDQKKPPPPCEACQGLSYFGRTGIFELLVVNDVVREALVKTPKLDLVRAAARKAGMRSLQEEGIALVAKGVTSLAELMRVLKG